MTVHQLCTPLDAEFGFAQALDLDGFSPGPGESARQILKGSAGSWP